jgi:outer membrane protein assembly factor BamB
VIVGCAVVGAGAGAARGGDWPQWRGANRDGRAADFAAPASWPKELKQLWKIDVGEGVATPALVGDRLYIFSRQAGQEVVRCVRAADGQEVWADRYESRGAEGPAQSFSGPRASPTVAEGKVVTFGVRGTVSCYDAASGKMLWRKPDTGYPGFFTSSSPVVTDGMAIVQVGGRNNGAVAAFDLNTGDQKWRHAGDSPGYASPVLMSAGGKKLVIVETEREIQALNVADGKPVWVTEYAAQRMGYNASTPIVSGETLIYSGSSRGTRAVKLEAQGAAYVARELWNNPEVSVQFNSPVLKDGVEYGLTAGNELFAINAADGKTLWKQAIGPAGGGGGGRRGEGGRPGGGPPGANLFQVGGGGGGRGPGGGPGGGPRRGMGGGGRGGYGSIVDAGSVMLALTPASELIVFKADPKGFAEVAKVKVAASQTHAHPVVSDTRIFIKDQESLTAYSVQ